VLCFGLPVPRGVYGETSHGAETVWRTQNLYYRRLDSLAVRFCALIEDSGAQAIPVFGCFPMGLNEKGEVMGYLNLIQMGEATGVGTIGRNGLLLHPRYGAKLMLGGLVTTADLPASRRHDAGPPDCPADCRICVDACPVHAISPDEKRVDIMRCLRHSARMPLMPTLWFLMLRAARAGAAARLMNLTAMDDHTLHVCSRCVALCPYGDEDRPRSRLN
jgi:epoxyqueuosine reductase QueG